MGVRARTGRNCFGNWCNSSGSVRRTEGPDELSHGGREAHTQALPPLSGRLCWGKPAKPFILALLLGGRSGGVLRSALRGNLTPREPSDRPGQGVRCRPE